ncbi:MAG: 30S ribosomal protein S6 [Nitrospinae bacterium]|nr:30S ribosomal protein S6 [Nitrospinota bacterium]
MTFYETIFIVKTDLGDEALAEKVTWATDILTSNGAEVINVEQWGKKRLAYQVNKQKHGIYVLMHYEGDPKAVPELERNLRLSEDILKHLTVKLEGAQVDKARAAAVAAAEEEARRAEERSAKEAAAESEAEPEQAQEAPPEADIEDPAEATEEAPIPTAQEEN